MRFLRSAMAIVGTCVAACSMAAAPASAAITLVNPGFETGTIAGWGGNGQATTGYAGYTARSGMWFGLVRAPGCPGQLLSQTFTATAGDTLTGWAFFKTQDSVPFDDDGDVTVVVTSTGSRTVVFSSSVDEVGDLGGTPWQSFTYTFASTGSYMLRVRVDNFDDCGTESAVGLDLSEGPADGDGDDIADATDNCPYVSNAGQEDHDGDAQGDVCDADDDNDAVGDERDNCQRQANVDQRDDDDDGTGDACDAAFDSNSGTATGFGWVPWNGEKVRFWVRARSAQGRLRGSCAVSALEVHLTCRNVDGFRWSQSKRHVVIVGDARVGNLRTRYRIALEHRSGEAARFTISTTSGLAIDGPIRYGNVAVRRGRW